MNNFPLIKSYSSDTMDVNAMLDARHKDNLLEMKRKDAREINNLEDKQSKERVELMKNDQN